MAEREIEERPVAGDQFHGGGEAALDDGKIACRKVPVEVMHVRVDLDTIEGRQEPRVDARSGHDNHSQAGDGTPGRRGRVDDAPQQLLADARAPDGHHADLVVGRVAELGPDRFPVGQFRGVESGDVVAGEVVVGLGPSPDSRAGQGRKGRGRCRRARRRRSPGPGSGDSGRCARSSRRCNRRSGPPPAGRRRAWAASRRSRLATHTLLASARGSRAGSSRVPRLRRRSTGRNDPLRPCHGRP